VNVRDQLRASRIMAVLRLGTQHTDPVALAERLVEAGVTAVECTMDSPDALATIDRLRRSLDSSVIVGAGTVTEVAQINALEQVGVSFIVSPHTDPALIERSRALNLEPIPGVLSPTDTQRALAAGASILKLFPAGPMGVAYLRAMSAPFSGASWIPTGGIELPDVMAWIDAGALCVGVGSALWTTPDVAAEIARLHTMEAP